MHRCTGVGKCVAPTTTGVMCPSYLATRDEKDSTRGRSRVLQEALDGELVDGLADPAVDEALDLCLACKGCASDCPTGVDMATYKAEALHQKYAGRWSTLRRPRSHLLARPAAAVGRAGRPDGAGGEPDDEARPGRPAGEGERRHRPAAVDPDVRAEDAAQGLATSHVPAAGTTPPYDAPDVWIWADSFTDHFLPQTAHAAIRVLEAAGLTVRVIREDACCGLTWVTTGQLDQARAIMARTVATLAPYVASGVPVVGLEPSCLATLRSDAVELIRRPARRRRRRGRADLRRAAGAPRLDAAGPHRRRGGRAAALPPRRRSWAGPPTSGCWSGRGAP